MMNESRFDSIDVLAMNDVEACFWKPTTACVWRFKSKTRFERRFMATTSGCRIAHFS